jgi:hypothetical protein
MKAFVLAAMFVVAALTCRAAHANEPKLANFNQHFGQSLEKSKCIEEYLLSVGVTRFQHQPDNHWFQRRYPSELHMVSGAYSLGIRCHKWIVSFEYLGKAYSRAYADPDDDNYNPDLSSTRACRKRCVHSHYSELPFWHGEGDVNGLSLLYSLESWGSASIEIGVIAFQSKWRQKIVRWYPPDRPDLRQNGEVRHEPRISFAPALNIVWAINDVSVVFAARGPLNQGSEYGTLIRGIATNVSVRIPIKAL